MNRQPPDCPTDLLLRAMPRESGSSTITPGSASAPARTTRILYIVPADVTRRAEAPRAINNAAVHLQRWVAGKLGGKSFLLNTPVVEEVASEKTVQWFRETPHDTSRASWFWLNVVGEMTRLGLGGFYDPNNRWIYYIEAHPEEGQGVGGAGGVALLPRNDVDGLLGLTREPLCRWVGGLGHELGHALGLPHPPECGSGQAGQEADPCQSLMYLGYLRYPDTWFTSHDDTRLKADPFIRDMQFDTPPYDCAQLDTAELWLPGHPS